MAKESSNTQVSRRSTSESLGNIISQGMSEDNREGINRVLTELREYVDKGRTYIQENPREAAGIAVAAGITAWALLATKPGRVVFEAGAAVAIPYLSRWLSGNMKPSH